MLPKIVKANSLQEFLTPERCSIAENWGSVDDKKVSIARARVEPGVTTKAHHLEGVQEIYLIAKGKGKVCISGLEPAEVAEGDIVVIPPRTSQRIANIGKTDLIFYCICTPSFTNDCYHDDENYSPIIGAKEAVEELERERKLDETRLERKISYRRQRTD